MLRSGLSTCIDVEIVFRETIARCESLYEPPGAPGTLLPFPTLQLWQRTVRPDKGHVKWRRQALLPIRSTSSQAPASGEGRLRFSDHFSRASSAGQRDCPQVVR
jgi:hypothetical protein